MTRGKSIYKVLGLWALIVILTGCAGASSSTSEQNNKQSQGMPDSLADNKLLAMYFDHQDIMEFFPI
jgi:glucose uptake protein GlcU